MRRTGIRSMVGSPIVVDGGLWGVIMASTTRSQPMPAGTELRIRGFTELVATALSNAQAHTELAASRARVVAAADETRRRIERDLHDGAQQRLVSLALTVRTVEAAVPAGELRSHLAQVVEGLTAVHDDLRTMARGLHPAELLKGGLGSALRTLARRSTVPVELRNGVDRRFPASVEVAVYFVVSEALANAA
ncbi:MAG: sensor histidine kinase [Candidatus Dormibacteria bacterium]